MNQSGVVVAVQICILTERKKKINNIIALQRISLQLVFSKVLNVRSEHRDHPDETQTKFSNVSSRNYVFEWIFASIVHPIGHTVYPFSE